MALRRPRSAPSGRAAATPAATPAGALRDKALVVELGLANAVVVERLCALESPFPYTTAKPRRLRRHHLHATASPQPNLQQQPSERAKKRASQVRGGIFAKEMRFRGAVMEYMRKSCARGHRSREQCADCCARLPACELLLCLALMVKVHVWNRDMQRAQLHGGSDSSDDGAASAP